MPTHRKRRQGRLAPRIAMIALLLAGLALVVIGFVQQGNHPVPTAATSADATVSVSPSATFEATHSQPPAVTSPGASVTSQPAAPAVITQQPAAPVQPPAPAINEAPVHVSFPAASTEVDVQPMDGSSYELEPPPDGFGHWLYNYGKAGAGAINTVYVIGHSCYGVGCTAAAFPFNNLSEAAAYKSGDLITLTTTGGHRVNYRVTNMCRYGKDSPPEQKCGTWDVVPGRLVLMSCYTQDPHGTNVVVFATIEK